MRRAQRARDNPALNVAIQAGNELEKPVVVFFGLSAKAHHANLRHYTFMIQGLRDVVKELRKRNVGFVLRGHPEHGILGFCTEVQPCLVVGDENPLRAGTRPSEGIGRTQDRFLDCRRRRHCADKTPRQGTLCRQNHTT
jgi:deoxyribodipyrimidine photo-lyase